MQPIQDGEDVSARLLSCERRAKTLAKVCPITREQSSFAQREKEVRYNIDGRHVFCRSPDNHPGITTYAEPHLYVQNVQRRHRGEHACVSSAIHTPEVLGEVNDEQIRLNWLRLSYHSTYACRCLELQIPNNSIIGLRYEDDLVRLHWGNNSRIGQLSST